MPGDYSRFTDDFRERFSRLLMQQGKVQLDADWNELVEILTRRDRLQANDTFGEMAVPRATTPDAFKITLSGSDFRIGAGRMYIDGVLAEAFFNDGKGGNPLSYINQPFFIDPPQTPPAGKGLFYLDVWERERTVVEDPDLLEVALGDVDTSTRTQTVWQVKFLRDLTDKDSPGQQKPTCHTDLAARFASGGRLTTSLNLPPGEPDPCLLPETGGFRDVENRHYRVEIHGNLNQPMFKFARDPVVTEIDTFRSVAGNAVLGVRRIGHDPVLRFAKGDYVEVLNDRHELHGLPGLLAEVDAVDEFSREITLKAVSTNPLPVAADVDPILHPRLTRWDQKPKPAAPLLTVQFGVPIPLEAGIEVTFTGGPFHHGDYWMFAARAANRSVGELVNAPPRGILHHYAPLALVDTFPPKVRTDCRILWPPECDCECAACVNPIDHNDGHYTIQMAIEDVKKKGGGKVCLKPGTYLFDRTIEIKSTNELTLIGHGKVTLDFTGEASEAILVEGSGDIVIEGIKLIRNGVAANKTEGIGITIRNCVLDVIVRDCELWMRMEGSLNLLPNHGIGIALDGSVVDAQILDCVIICNIGVGFIPSAAIAPTGAAPTPVRTLVFARVEIRGNFILSLAVAVKIHAIGLAVTVRQNWISASEVSCVWLEGTTPQNYCNVVDENVLAAGRTGIGVNAGSTTISNNVIRGSFFYDKTLQGLTFADATFSSIAVYTANVDDVLESVLVIGNRCSNTLGMGIQVAGTTAGLMIKQNLISTTAGGGIVLTDKARASKAVIENNDLRDVAVGLDRGLKFSAGIRIAAQSDVTVAANVIAGVGPGGIVRQDQPQCAAILVEAAEVARILGNRISAVASSSQESACIDIVPPTGMIEITNNIIDVDVFSPATGSWHCYAVRVAGAPVGFDVAHPVFININVPEATPANTGAPSTVSVARFDDFEFGFWPQWPWFTFLPSTRLLLIRANEMRCQGHLSPDAPMVLVEDHSTRCTFGGNICINLPSLRNQPRNGVRLTAFTVVADSNQILGTILQRDDSTGSGGVALDINTVRSNTAWTVIGNIVDGGIRVTTNTPLPQPWLALNRLF
jgi:hypothetical protein